MYIKLSKTRYRDQKGTTFNYLMFIKAPPSLQMKRLILFYTLSRCVSWSCSYLPQISHRDTGRGFKSKRTPCSCNRCSFWTSVPKSNSQPLIRQRTCPYLKVRIISNELSYCLALLLLSKTRQKEREVMQTRSKNEKWRQSFWKVNKGWQKFHFLHCLPCSIPHQTIKKFIWKEILTNLFMWRINSCFLSVRTSSTS